MREWRIRVNSITMVYFDGCPEAKHVRAALLSAGVFGFKVVLQDDLPINDPLRKLSSPSVLKGDELIYGVKTDGEVASCTFDPANYLNYASLTKRFTELKSIHSNKKHKFKALLGTGFSALLVLKCPACIPGLVAILTTLGLGFIITPTVLKSILIIMLLITLITLLVSCLKTHRNYYPLALGGIFSIMLYTGRFSNFESINNEYLIYISIGGLLAASLWDWHLKTRKACSACI